MPREQVYNKTMYILVGMLILGLICNLLVRPVSEKHFMTDAKFAEEKHLAHDRTKAAEVGSSSQVCHATGSLTVALAWTAVGIPLAWGVYRTLLSAAKFFY